jgi:hypothetical protein
VYGKRDGNKERVGVLWDPDHAHHGQEDTAPAGAVEGGMAGGEGKLGDHGVPTGGAIKPVIAVPEKAAAAVAVGMILSQANVTSIATEAIDLSKTLGEAGAKSGALRTLVEQKIDHAVEQEMKSVAEKLANDAEYAARTAADKEKYLAELRDSARERARADVMAEIKRQTAEAERLAAIDRDQGHGPRAEQAAADLPSEESTIAASKRAKDALGQDPVAGNVTSRHEGVPSVRRPAERHTLAKVSQRSVAKDVNTVIAPYVDVANDTAAINEGKAVAAIGPDGVRTYTVNGRTYGVEPSGTLYPMTGDGFIVLNRNAYKILGILNKFGDTPRALEIIQLQAATARFTDEEIEMARGAWRAGRGGE